MRDCLAKLAISIARKLGALIFLVPEDIVDVRPKLVRATADHLSIAVAHAILLQQILTFVASLWSLSGRA